MRTDLSQAGPVGGGVAWQARALPPWGGWDRNKLPAARRHFLVQKDTQASASFFQQTGWLGSGLLEPEPETGILGQYLQGKGVREAQGGKELGQGVVSKSLQPQPNPEEPSGA